MTTQEPAKPMKRQGAATFVQVSLEEMDKVIRRGFRAMDPKVGRSSYGEVLYELTPDDEDPETIIRIQTSIFQGAQARGEGEDSIRVTIINAKSNRPITGKYQRVHRTQNWKDNLRSRIEDAIEEVEDLGEARAKARDIARQREEQQKLQQERPEEARSERDRQVALLQSLARSQSPKAGIFADMLSRLRPGQLLTDKQLAWAESEAKRFVR